MAKERKIMNACKSSLDRNCVIKLMTKEAQSNKYKIIKEIFYIKRNIFMQAIKNEILTTLCIQPYIISVQGKYPFGSVQLTGMLFGKRIVGKVK